MGMYLKDLFSFENAEKKFPLGPCEKENPGRSIYRKKTDDYEG
jgi:hypothetical protein